MATARPQVTVFSAINGTESSGTAVMPHVMLSPVRPDLVRYVHTNQQKNFRQPHGVKEDAGYETSAESWGTGRAVARIPRVSGGGTHRAGQGAFGNMCRGGGMFAPKKTWRRWHRRINLTERRHAMASAIAATSVPGLVMARGHRVDDVRELPIVVSDEIQEVTKTKQAKEILIKLGCKADLLKVEESKQIRKGVGKLRNRRYVCRRGPLLIYSKSNGCHKAFRSIPGVDLLSVEALNILKLAPGGTLGRLVIWTESAFKKLDQIYGEYLPGTSSLKSYTLPRTVMTNADLSRIINSMDVQIALNPAKDRPTQMKKANPLNNKVAMSRLNPASSTLRKRKRLASTPGKSEYLFFQEKRQKLNDEKTKVWKMKRDQTKLEHDELSKKIEEAANAVAKTPAVAAEDESASD